MSLDAFDPAHLDRFAGTWALDGHHALLPGEPIRGEAVLERLGDGPFLVQRTRIAHPRIPDAVAVIGPVDGRPRMAYFDTRGVRRVYDVQTAPGVLRYALDTPGFAQRYRAELTGDGDRIDAAGELRRDGGRWQADLSLTYRRR